MKNAKIVLVAEWDGWCGACAAERPLVLTRTGRQRLRTWLAAAADDSCPLVLTCRLCGTGVDVPLERDDPPVVGTADESEPTPAASAGTEAPSDAVATAADVPAALPVPVPVQTRPSAAELSAGRQAVASALGALLARRSAALAAPSTVPVPVPVAAAPAVPAQRTASSGGLAELQLLADGIDLLSSGRS